MSWKSPLRDHNSKRRPDAADPIAPYAREAAAPAPPRVLHAAAELFPWVKTGGLGDVMAALPPALLAVGVDARLVVPGYPALLDALQLTEVARLPSPFAIERIRLSLARLPDSGVRLYVI